MGRPRSRILVVEDDEAHAEALRVALESIGHQVDVADSVDAAIREVLNFYSNYHSSRYVGQDLVIRLRQAPDEGQLDQMNDRYSRILSEGRIQVSGALPEENGDAPDLARLVLRYNRRDTGILRRLVNDLNALVPDTSSADPASPPQIVSQEMSATDEEEEQDDRG